MSNINGKILLVDNDEFSSQVMVKRISKRGFNVSYCNSGKNIINVIRDNNIDLILLDIRMPVINGMDILKRIRKFKKSVELPIIMVTASDEVSDILDSLNAGANDFINKPVNVDVALARIQSQLMIREYYYECIRKSELATISAMVATYNHEINNPLTIAFGYLRQLQNKENKSIALKLDKSLKRISNIVSKIQNLNEENSEKTDYSNSIKMFDLSKK